MYYTYQPVNLMGYRYMKKTSIVGYSDSPEDVITSSCTCSSYSDGYCGTLQVHEDVIESMCLCVHVCMCVYTMEPFNAQCVMVYRLNVYQLVVVQRCDLPT